MASPSRISIKIPKSLRTTASERTKLKKAFTTEVVSILKKHRSPVGSDITNVDNPVIVVIDEVASGGSGSKAGAGKKASKKK